MIKVNNISKSFVNTQVISNISATFEKGKTNLIIGQSGSGKTVLMKCLLGLYDVDNGEIFFDEKKYDKDNISNMSNLRKQIGMVFQGSALFDSMTVLDNIMFPLRMFSSKSESDMISRAKEVIKRVDLKDSDDKYPSEISGGMKKRVAIARAIINNPAILLADEPTGALDSKTTEDVLDLFDQLHESGITIVLVTHEDEVANRAKKIAKFKDGRIVELKVN